MAHVPGEKQTIRIATSNAAGSQISSKYSAPSCLLQFYPHLLINDFLQILLKKKPIQF